jgi:hypothetical protein
MDADTFQNNLTGTLRQGYVQNRWWMTAVGPIRKRKLFFFVGFEGYRESIASALLTDVPTRGRERDSGFDGEAVGCGGADHGQNLRPGNPRTAARFGYAILPFPVLSV